MAAKNREYFEEILELLEPYGDVTGKAMFGGWGFWEQGHMFGLISSTGTFYLKTDEASEPRYRKAKSTQFAPEMSSSGREMKMPYWTVPKSVMKDDLRLQEWVEEAIAVGHATSKKKKPSAKKAPAKKASATKATA
jgi:DNA transformation protein